MFKLHTLFLIRNSIVVPSPNLPRRNTAQQGSSWICATMTSEPPSTSFSSSGEDVIHQVIDVVSDHFTSELSSQEFDSFYDIERTAKEIIRGGYKRIALQFPDELLHDSVPIFHRLNQTISALAPETESSDDQELYVLADTSYGSCCVDEVAAQHVNADLMVHYGHACMTQTSRLPVIYVFGKRSLDVERCVTELLNAFDTNLSNNVSTAAKQTGKVVSFKHDVVYHHLADSIFNRLTQALSHRLPPIPVLHHQVSTMTHPSSKSITESPSSLSPPSDDQKSDETVEPMTTFYVGCESLGLSNLLMTNALNDVYRYDPATETVVHESATGRTNKMLMRRYAAVQKARDADVFGILVGTLGVASYLPLIGHIRRLLAHNQKKTYTISVGKLNPAKLANFLEVECFVLIACPENTLISDKEFLRPIITPYELEVAMQAERSWTGKYVLDFGRLLTEANATPDDTVEGEEGDPLDNDPDQPVFSLVTGTYRHPKRYGGKQDLEKVGTPTPDSSAIVVRSKDDQIVMVDSAAAQFLHQRTYRGLEMCLGEDVPSVLEQGRSGIARGYQDDLSHKESQ